MNTFNDIDTAIQENTLQAITDNEIYKQVIKDSFGGVLYNVANQDKYDDKQILALWNSLSSQQQESANGIIKGAIDFLQGAI